MTEYQLKELREEILAEIDRMKHPEMGPFNFGLSSADAAVRRVITQWLEKIEKNNGSKVF